ncbi:MAG TPA: DUF1428 domain-containing protein [Gemmatimonadaceae bacterium]|jgi:uncharacterized protein YbaA (DUF1428 family)|nr:DUF1428 domain-containing protein [Gemmatimonadaceae bacterium]
MPYVDGFLLPVAKNKVQAYRRMARMAGRVWRKYGALEFRECVGDDLNTKMGPSFKKAVKAKPNETVFFSWIVFKSKTHRNRVNARVMKDPKIAKMMASDMPMDPKRMYYGGFKFAVDL